jgi:hypothetical protein
MTDWKVTTSVTATWFVPLGTTEFPEVASEQVEGDPFA